VAAGLTATQARPCSCWRAAISSTGAASLPGFARQRLRCAPFARSDQVTDLSVSQMELPRNNGRESWCSPHSSDSGLTPGYPPSLPAHPRRAAGGAWQRERTPRPCSVCGARHLSRRGDCRLVGARFRRWREETLGWARCLTLRYSLPLSVWVDPLTEHRAGGG